MASNRNKLEFTYPSARPAGPPEKRRRITDNQRKDVDDDLWDDDDLDFTQDQLEKIDFEITMSQRPTTDRSSTSQRPTSDWSSKSQRPTADRNSTSSNRLVGKGTMRSHSEGNVLSNSAKLNIAHSSGHKNIPDKTMVTKTSKGTNNQRGTLPFQNSFKSISENKNQKNLHPTAPFGGKVSTYSSTSNRPCPAGKSQGASSSAVKSQLTPLTASTGSGQFSPALPSAQARTESSNVTQQHLQKLQKELAAVKEEMKSQHCQKEGEVNMLRKLLQETKLELSSSRQEQVKMRDQHKMEQTEKEKSLMHEVERLKTQVQFAERDRDELQTRCKVLEKKGSATGSPLVSHTQSPQRKKNEEARSPQTPKSNFPSRVTFMADEAAGSSRSPRRKPAIEETARIPESETTKEARKKKFKVSVTNQRGRSSGPSLVSLILPRSSSGIPSGIVGLLQAPARVKPESSPKDTDDNVALTNNRWIQNLHQQNLSQEAEQPSIVVPQNYYSLAVQAISSLLRTDLTHQPDQLLEGHTDQAVFLLPIIESYISRYVDLIRTVPEPSSSVSSSSVGSLSSTLDSYDSLSSHQRSLAMDLANQAQQAEQWALNALYILYVLVDLSSSVRRTVLGETEQDKVHCKRNPKSDVQVPAEEQMSTDQASTSDESGNSSTSSAMNNNTIERIARKCQTLELLMRTTNPVLPNGKVCSTDIVEVSLKILSLLASDLSPDNLLRYEPLLRQDVLQSCLIEEFAGPAEQRLRCHLQVLDLVKSLCRSSDMMPLLCNSTEDCLLYTLYTAAASPPQGANPEYRTRFGLKLVQLLTSVLSSHQSGMSTILESDCHCCCEVVRTITQLLHHGLQRYREVPSDCGLSLLQQGVVLLAQLAGHRRVFFQQRQEIMNQYIEVVIGLDVVFKDSDDFIEHDDVIQQLWDFDVEYHQESQNSEEMDVT